MANQTYRVLELIRRFNNNEKICIDRLKDEYLWEGKSEKTIRRDLDIIKATFPDTFHLIPGEVGCYKAITTELFANITSADNMSLLIQTFNIAQRSNLFESLDINASDKKIVQRKMKESKGIYLFKTKPFENKTADFKLFKTLEHCIYHKKELRLEYEITNDVVQKVVKPYKIVFMNENFYLAGEAEQGFSLFRLLKIRNVTKTKNNFHQNRDMVDYINNMQTLFGKYTPSFRQNLMEVIVGIDKSKASYFKAKKHLLSQETVEEKEDGTLVLKFTVTQALEVEELIKKWLPYIKVIEPRSLKMKIDAEIREYLR